MRGVPNYEANITIKVDKRIPMPHDTGNRYTKYPWGLMQIGDSFLFPKGKDAHSCYQTIYYKNRKGPEKFEIRTTPDGIRCWRVG